LIVVVLLPPTEANKHLPSRGFLMGQQKPNNILLIFVEYNFKKQAKIRG